MKTVIYLVCLVLALMVWANTANADLVSQWEFNGNADDSMGINNGTLMNGATIGTDPVHGQVLSLDGINDYVDCGNNSSLDVGGGSFTVAAWVKRPSRINGFFAIVTKGFGPLSSYTGWDFQIAASYDNQWLTYVWTPEHTDEHATEVAYYPFIADSWYHIAAVRNTVNLNISYYIDGQLAASFPLSDADYSNTANLNIGKLSGVNDQYFSGMLDDVRIYDNALTAGEIAAIVPEPCTLILLSFGAIIIRKACRKSI
jgi:hypothetical protein